MLVASGWFRLEFERSVLGLKALVDDDVRQWRLLGLIRGGRKAFCTPPAEATRQSENLRTKNVRYSWTVMSSYLQVISLQCLAQVRVSRKHGIIRTLSLSVELARSFDSYARLTAAGDTGALQVRPRPLHLGARLSHHS